MDLLKVAEVWLLLLILVIGFIAEKHGWWNREK